MSWIQSFYNYLFPSEILLPIPSGERLTYVTQKDIKLLKQTSEKYYEICTKEVWLTEKTIPRYSQFRVLRYVKESTGQIKVLAQVDQILEPVDLSEAFMSLTPLVPDPTYIKAAY